MSTEFEALGIAAPILKAVTEMGFEQPTEVQSRVIPKILEKNDLIVMSKTGSGKTAAFSIPMIENVTGKEKTAEALILTPTRELAVQVDKEVKALSKHLSFKTTAIYGQHNMRTEIKALKDGATIITGTPGRVYHHIQEKNLVTKGIKYLVLDEADRMLDMGFIDQVIKIIKALPRDRVTLLFSATMPPAIKRICQSYMKDPESIELGTDTKTVDTITQLYYRVERNEKRHQLDRVLKSEQPDSCMVFCNTRDEVDRVHRYLANKGYFAMALHGTKTQNNRMKTIQKFKSGELQILVATDIAARGIHIDDLSLVVNYDIPQDKDSYIHRIGRTGRAGNGGRAVALITGDDLFGLYEIEEHVGVLIEEEELPTDALIEDIIKSSTCKWVGKKFVPQPNKPKSQRKPSHHANKGGKGQGNKSKQTHHNKQNGHQGKPKPQHKHQESHTKKEIQKPIQKAEVKQVAKTKSVQSQKVNVTKKSTPKQLGYDKAKVDAKLKAIQEGKQSKKTSLFKRITSAIKGK